MAFKMSSCLGLFSMGANWPFLFEARIKKDGQNEVHGSEGVTMPDNRQVKLTSKRLLEGIIGVSTSTNLYHSILHG